MKTWILKNDLSYSPQAAFRMYACGARSSKSDIEAVKNIQAQHRILVSKIKTQVKSLARLLNQGIVLEI